MTGTAAAAPITFEGFGGNTIFGDEITGNGLQIATSDGYNFTSSGDHFHFGNGLGGVPVNGTSILLQDRNYVINMVKAGGGAFDLLSGDFGEDVSFGLPATTIRVTGTFSAGGTITQDVVLDGNSALFQNVALPGFTNLVSVTFDGIGNPSTDVVANGFTLDNLNVQDANVVPEPASIISLGIGAVCAFGAVRRRKTAAA
jgi:hypothetical protein